jgi:hypothetical protein
MATHYLPSWRLGRMGRAKDIRVKVIPSKIANAFVKKHHYSGRVVPNSTLHFGAFLDGRLHGVMSYGPSMKKVNMLPIVSGTGWNEFIELNRMAFDDVLPKNSESRCIAISLRMIKKNAPQIKWVISFSDGTQCGDGVIYRASGFCLTQIKENTELGVNPHTGEIMQSMAVFHAGLTKEFANWKKVSGFQLRYIYFLDPTYKSKLTCPILPFSKIDEMGARMYKGERLSPRSKDSVASGFQPEDGGANPTLGLL